MLFCVKYAVLPENCALIPSGRGINSKNRNLKLVESINAYELFFQEKQLAAKGDF